MWSISEYNLTTRDSPKWYSPSQVWLQIMCQTHSWPQHFVRCWGVLQYARLMKNDRLNKNKLLYWCITPYREQYKNEILRSWFLLCPNYGFLLRGKHYCDKSKIKMEIRWTCPAQLNVSPEFYIACMCLLSFPRVYCQPKLMDHLVWRTIDHTQHVLERRVHVNMSWCITTKAKTCCRKFWFRIIVLVIFYGQCRLIFSMAD